MHRLQTAVFIPLKPLRQQTITARVPAKAGRRLRLAVIQLVDTRPLGPGIIGRSRLGWLGHNLKLDQAAAAVAQGGGHAVGTGVAAADDDDIFTGGAEETAVSMPTIQQTLGVAV
jgi:hypothetical protein